MLNANQAMSFMIAAVVAGIVCQHAASKADFDRFRASGVREASATVGAGPDAAASPLDDAQITAMVKGSLATEFGVAARSIHVDTMDSVVTLSGDVGTELQREIALQVARDTLGVSDVVDVVTVRETAPVDFWPGLPGHRRSTEGTI